jgi:hypothetical protein
MTTSTRAAPLIRQAVLVLTALPGSALVATRVPAHHSAAMFDAAKTLEVTAEIKEFQWTNPHVWIQVYLTNDAGGKEEWSIEGLGRNSLARTGWRPSSFEPGDIVSLRIHPMRDGSHGAQFVGAKFPDGSTLGRWDAAE